MEFKLDSIQRSQYFFILYSAHRWSDRRRFPYLGLRNYAIEHAYSSALQMADNNDYIGYPQYFEIKGR